MIKLYHIEGLNHSDNMTIVYRPKEKIVINADIYGRPAQYKDGPRRLAPTCRR
jgi:hypothetical protein